MPTPNEPHDLPTGVATLNIAALLRHSDALAASPAILRNLEPDECFCCHHHGANYIITDTRGALQYVGCRDCDDIPISDIRTGSIAYIFGEPLTDDATTAPIVAMLTT